MASSKNLLLLFDRPGEPVFMPKGKDKAVFDVPSNFFTEKYRPIGSELQNRFGEDAGTRIPVRGSAMPDLSIPEQLGRQENFSLFLPKHRKLSKKLIEIFMGAKSIDDLQVR
jgi:tyrosinase